MAENHVTTLKYSFYTPNDVLERQYQIATGKYWNPLQVFAESVKALKERENASKDQQPKR